MPSEQLKLVRQQRHRKRLKWNDALERRLHLQEIRDTGSHVFEAASASFAYWSPFVVYSLSLTTEICFALQFKKVESVVAALFCFILEFSCLCGLLQSEFHNNFKQCCSYKLALCQLFDTPGPRSIDMGGQDIGPFHGLGNRGQYFC